MGKRKIKEAICSTKAPEASIAEGAKKDIIVLVKPRSSKSHLHFTILSSEFRDKLFNLSLGGFRSYHQNPP
jgi:hypothetical protein